MYKITGHFVSEELTPFPKQPHPRAVFDNERGRWKVGTWWYMPDKGYMSPWVTYDWDKKEVICECLDMDGTVEITEK